jgi:hypothetical protein
MRSFRNYFLIAAGIGLGAMSSTYAGTIGFGSLSDPLGDAVGADIISASVTIDSSQTALFSMTYAPGTSLGDAAGTFNLDLDKNPLTGAPGVDTGHNDSALMGTDYVFTMDGTAFGGQASVYRFVGPGWASVGQFPVTYLGTTEQVTIPLSALGGDDGAMNFTGVSQQNLAPGTYTTIQDYIPDLHQTPGTITLREVPELSFTLPLFGFALMSLAGLRYRLR